jgi:hypothetical protein
MVRRCEPFRGPGVYFEQEHRLDRVDRDGSISRKHPGAERALSTERRRGRRGSGKPARARRSALRGRLGDQPRVRNRGGESALLGPNVRQHDAPGRLKQESREHERQEHPGNGLVCAVTRRGGADAWRLFCLDNADEVNAARRLVYRWTRSVRVAVGVREERVQQKPEVVVGRAHA